MIDQFFDQKQFTPRCGRACLSEQMIEQIASSGVPVDDSPYIEAAQQAASEIAALLEQALSLSPRVYTSSWTGFGALNSICTPQGTHDVPWIAAGKAMHEDS